MHLLLKPEIAAINHRVRTEGDPQPPKLPVGRRVAVAYDVCSPFTIGGAESHYRGLTEELGRRGHDVTYLTSRYWDGPAALDRDGVRLLALTKRWGPPTGNRTMVAALRYAVRLFAHLLRAGGGYDVVEVAALPPTAAVAAWLGMLPHRQTLLVMDWHEVWPRGTWTDEFGLIGNLGWLAEIVARPLGRRVAFSNLHANRLPGGAVKVPEFISIDDPTDEQNALEPDRSLLLCVGRLVPNKRFDLLPGTLAELRSQHPGREWHALVIGAGPELDRIQAEASAHGVSDLIEFDSGLSSEDLSNRLSTSGVLFHPSRREGFGIILLEASAHGLPSVVCTAADNAGVELIQPGENGEVSESAEFANLAACVSRILADEGGRTRTFAWWEQHRSDFTSASAAEALESLWAQTN